MNTTMLGAQVYRVHLRESAITRASRTDTSYCSVDQSARCGSRTNSRTISYFAPYRIQQLSFVASCRVGYRSSVPGDLSPGPLTYTDKVTFWDILELMGKVQS